MTETVTVGDIRRARQAIAGHVRHTPLVRSAALSARTGTGVHLKLETAQDIGAFKIRGATNKLLSLDDAARARGVVAYSTGNHGRGVAEAARRNGVRAVICMSEMVPDNKRRAIADLGAEVRIHGRNQDEAMAEALRLVEGEGMTLVDPIDDPAIIAGQGTVGLEILEDLPEVATVLVPLSGGGLISGVACALKAADPAIRVIGVSMARGAAMYESQKAGRPVRVEEFPGLADSLGGGIGQDNRYTFRMVRELVDDILLLDEAAIARGMRQLFREEGLVVEGAGAVGVGALLEGLVSPLRGEVAVVVSGRNVDMDRFLEIVGEPDKDGGGA